MSVTHLFKKKLKILCDAIGLKNGLHRYAQINGFRVLCVFSSVRTHYNDGKNGTGISVSFGVNTFDGRRIILLMCGL